MYYSRLIFYHVGNRFERASKGGRDLGLNVKAQKQRVGGSQAQK